MTTVELLHTIAKEVLLFGGALLVLSLLIAMVYVLLTLIRVNKLISTFQKTFLTFREGMQKLLDPLLMFVNMLRMSVEEGNNAKKGKKVSQSKKKIKKKKGVPTKKSSKKETKKTTSKTTKKK